jgi:heat shock protein 4
VSNATKPELDRLIEQEVMKKYTSKTICLCFFLKLQMISQDKIDKERSDAKNAVEEYVYDMRGKLDGGEYTKYADEKTRHRLLNDLRSTENWLYDQGMNQERNVYIERLKSLKVKKN